MKIQCPVCSGCLAISLESIMLEEQHLHYSPRNKVVQKMLCDEAGKAAPHGYRMHQCTNCGLEFADPLKAPNAEWYGHAYAALSLYPRARWEYSKTIERIAPGQAVMDIGCGSGYFLQLCQRAGLKATGMDFAINAVQICKESGLDVALLDVFGSASTDGRKFDAITAFHVLEHMDSPRELFEYAARLAKGGSRFYVSIPGRYRARRYFRERDFLDQPPHHMSRWTERALEQVPGSTGWKCVSIEHEPISFRIKFWEISRRTSFYIKLTGKKSYFKITDKVARILLLPYAAWMLATTHRRLAGFSMLVTYEMGKSGRGV